MKKLVLFHHDPQRTDEQVYELLKLAQKRAKKVHNALEIIAAVDRKEIFACLKKRMAKSMLR